MWTAWCTKYKSYQQSNDFQGMYATLQQIAQQFNVSLVQAFGMLRERCREVTGDYTFVLPSGYDFPGSGTTHGRLTDCYDCRRNVMNRVAAGVKCPEGWISVPVVNGRSKNPCKGRRINKSNRKQYRGLSSTDIRNRYKNMSGPFSMRKGNEILKCVSVLTAGVIIGVVFKNDINKFVGKIFKK